MLGVDLGAHEPGGGGRGALTAALGARAEELAAPVEVRLGEVSVQVEPEAVGLAVDVEATVARRPRAAVGARSTALFGSREVDPVVTVDVEQLAEALREPAGRRGEAMTLPEITFDGITPVPVYPEPGLGLDAELAAGAGGGLAPREQLAQGWADPIAVRVPLVEIQPVTTAEEVDRLLEELARPAVAAPVTVTPAARRVELGPGGDRRQPASSPRTTHGEIVPEVDPEALRKGLGRATGQGGGQPQGRRHSPRRRATAGGAERPRRAGGHSPRWREDLLAVLPAPAPRDGHGGDDRGEPGGRARRRSRSSGSSSRSPRSPPTSTAACSSPRSQNIVRVAEMVDGALVRPGEVFSLNGHTGERDYAQGFQDAPVIIGGGCSRASAGGSRSSPPRCSTPRTTPGWRTSSTIRTRIHYTRYPPVIEATIFYPTLDLKFRNDTDYGILIDTSYTEGSVTVTLWGTKVWDEVKTEWSAKRDITRRGPCTWSPARPASPRRVSTASRRMPGASSTRTV